MQHPTTRLPAVSPAPTKGPAAAPDLARSRRPCVNDDDDNREFYADLSGVRVLVVDDEVDSRDLFAMVLESCGAVVTTAGRAAEAYAAVQREPPQVIVSDIGMPGEDGLSLMRRVRALSAIEGGTVPAVAVTAFTGPDHRARALAAGFNMHVAKPFEPQILVAIVRRLAS